MATKSKYVALSGATTTNLNLNIDSNNLSLIDSAIDFVGSAQIETVFVQPGMSVDFTKSGSGADKLYVTGRLQDYTFSLSGSTILMTRGAGATLESVRLVKAATAGLSDNVVFADGTVSTFALYDYAAGVGITPVPSGEVSGSFVAPTTTTGAMKLVALDAATFSTTLPGTNVQVVGSSGVDNVYVKAGATMDLTLLGGSIDNIYFTGKWADYTKTVVGTTITFTRTVGSATETVKVVGSTGVANDNLYFADGSVQSNSARTAITANASVALSSITGNNPAAATPVQINTLSLAEVGALTSAQVALLGPQQRANITAAQVGALAPSVLPALTVDAFDDLSAAQLAGITATQAPQLSAAQLGALSAAQIGGFTGAALAALAPATLAGLSTSALGGITAAQAPQLTAAQVVALDAKVAALAPAAFGALSSAALGALTQAEGAVLTGQQLAALPTAQMTALSNAALGGVTPAALAALSEAQLGAFTYAQAHAIPNASLAQLTSAQLVALDNDNVAPVFSAATATATAAENIATTATVFTAAATDANLAAPNKAVTYSLSGTDAAAFSISASTGAVQFVASPNFEAKSSYSFNVVATDGGGLSSSQAVTLGITDVNEAPVAGTAIAAQNLVGGQPFSFTVPAGAFTDPDTSGPNATLTYSATLANGSALPAWLSFNAATQTFSGTPPAGTSSDISIRVTVTDGGATPLSATQDFVLHPVAPALSSALTSAVTNLDVQSNIVLTSTENLVKGTGNIVIHNTGGTGLGGESADHTMTIDVNSSMVSIVGNKIVINPEFDLDFGNNYTVTVDAGAFVGASSALATAAITGTTIGFSTVMPTGGASSTGPADGMLSQQLNASGVLEDSYRYWLIEGLGNAAQANPNGPYDLATGKVAMVFKDWNPAGGSDLTGDGIGVNSPFNIRVTGFGADDLIYIDDQSNSALMANRLDLSAVNNAGTPPTLLQFDAAPVGTEGGAFIEVVFAGNTSAVAASIQEMQTITGKATPSVISA